MFLKETKKKLSHKNDRSIYIDIEGERNSNGNIVWRDSWEGGGRGKVFLIEFLELSIINKQKSQ